MASRTLVLGGVGRLEDWKVGWMEGWKIGRLDDLEMGDQGVESWAAAHGDELGGREGPGAISFRYDSWLSGQTGWSAECLRHNGLADEAAKKW